MPPTFVIPAWQPPSSDALTGAPPFSPVHYYSFYFVLVADFLCLAFSHPISYAAAAIVGSSSVRSIPYGDADAIDTGVDTPITTTNTFSNEFSLSTEPE